MKTQAPTKTAAQGVPVKKMNNAAKEKGVELMLKYKNLTEGRQSLLDSIAAQLENYDKQIIAAEKNLVQFGETFKKSFDEKNRLILEHGYLLISKSTEVITDKKFDLAVFAEAKPDMISVSLKVAPIKAAMVDKDQRKELKAFGIDTTTKEKIQVKLETFKPLKGTA